VLAAGIEQHLARLDALRDIRRVLTNLGDVRAELTVTARYFLAELDSQVELFRLLISEVRAKPPDRRCRSTDRFDLPQFHRLDPERNQPHSLLRPGCHGRHLGPRVVAVDQIRERRVRDRRLPSR
jgi:hypothetical protein